MNKIFLLKDGRYAAFCGNASVFSALVDWLNGGEKVDLREDEEVQGIIISPNGEALELSSSLRLYPACLPWAGGSGECIALTAMFCGKTATEAVEIACQLDNQSGGPVTSILAKKPIKEKIHGNKTLQKSTS